MFHGLLWVDAIRENVSHIFGAWFACVCPVFPVGRLVVAGVSRIARRLSCLRRAFLKGV